ncbi:hypothetical protein [Erythrobacter ani]|uniref:Secreted protein n=1 Tax=Erythrobacter ani TaxID=2827235 RepID=A0ABS6SJT2_9SPHN|nr:hypothetical protein [Erythrobacter ani]MBV7265273.1 hypothetical protein [Erythrobacter ani]
MRTHLRYAAPLCLTILGLTACTGETMPDSGDEVSDEVIDATSGDLDIEQPVARETPLPVDGNGAKSAETDQPAVGADAVSGEVGSGAEAPNPPGS